MEIKWICLETNRSEEGQSLLSTAKIKYESQLFSKAFREQLEELHQADFTCKLQFVRLWRSQSAMRDGYCVFSRLNLQRGGVLLQTDISSTESSSAEAAIKVARIGCGAFVVGQEVFNVGRARSSMHLEAGFDARKSTETGYQNWQNGRLVVVQGVSEPKITIFRNQSEERTARLLTQYVAMSDLSIKGTVENENSERQPVLVKLTGCWELG